MKINLEQTKGTKNFVLLRALRVLRGSIPSPAHWQVMRCAAKRGSTNAALCASGV